MPEHLKAAKEASENSGNPPDGILFSPILQVTKRLHLPPRRIKTARSPLRDYPHLSGPLIERKKQLAAMRPKRAYVSGAKHYKVRRKKGRLVCASPAGDAHRYRDWKWRIKQRTGFEVNVSKAEWWNLLYARAYEGRPQIARYDETLPYTLDNLYVGVMRWGAKPELIPVVDARACLAELAKG